jgi:hypothetical protein
VPSSSDLSAWLLDAAEQDLVRRTAHWLHEVDYASTTPDLTDPGVTGSPVVDALVAAASETVALRIGQDSPAWTSDPARFLDHFWYPGPPSLFAWALAHAPAPFQIRGVLIEADSLASV